MNLELNFRRLISTLALFLELAAFGGVVHAQNLKDNILNNDLDGLKAKVALLEPSFKDFPYIAFYLGNTKEYQQSMLDYLISKGASADQIDDQGVGPLYYAITTNNLNAVTTLIAAKANVNHGWSKPEGVNWAYGYSSEVYTRSGRVVELDLFDPSQGQFILAGAGKSTLRPLAVALYSEDTDIVPTLLKAGADPLGWIYRIKDTKTSTAEKPIYKYSNTIFDHVVGSFAVSRGDIDFISPTFFANAVSIWKAVLALPSAKKPIIDPKLTANLFAYFATGAIKEFKAELVKTGDSTLTFLPYAALAGSWDIVDLILKYNSLEIDDSFNKEDQSLLEWAIKNLHTEAVKILLEHGATIPVERNPYQIPLVHAAINNKPELVEILLKFKADPNNGQPLFYTHSSPAVRPLLLEAGADPKAIFELEGDYGDKVLHFCLLAHAAQEDKPEAVAFWLEYGLDPNGIGTIPPILSAVYNGNPESVRLLLEKGADPNYILNSDRNFLRTDIYANKPLIEYAKGLVSDKNDPLEKSRSSQVVRLLEKAIAEKKP